MDKKQNHLQNEPVGEACAFGPKNEQIHFYNYVLSFYIFKYKKKTFSDVTQTHTWAL